MNLNTVYMARITTALIMLCLSFGSQAQNHEKTPYYISINASDGKRIHETSDETLSLQYDDIYGRWKEVPLKIYDWKRNLVATLSLDKTYGLNSVVINLRDVYGGWEQNKVYICELRNEVGRKYEVPFRLVPPPDKKAPDVTIFVNPLQMQCDDDALAQNIVEFYGEIKGGKAPYTISWFVLNSTRNDFLYQPREEVISSPGKTMAITVDKRPDYYVVLYVRDACGNSQQKIVNLVCEENKKKINTIFAEELGLPQLNTKKIQ